jgi:hypothetical protein
MTNLFLVNAEVATCLVGTYVVDSTTGLPTVVGAQYEKCSGENIYGCFQRAEGNNRVFGCASESDCSQVECCTTADSCNDPSIYGK